MHPRARVLDQEGRFYYACCGLYLVDEYDSNANGKLYISDDDVRGCVRVDHIPRPVSFQPKTFTFGEPEEDWMELEEEGIHTTPQLDHVTIVPEYKLDAAQRQRLQNATAAHVRAPQFATPAATKKTLSVRPAHFHDPTFSFDVPLPVALGSGPVVLNLHDDLWDMMQQAYRHPAFHATRPDLVKMARLVRDGGMARMTSRTGLVVPKGEMAESPSEYLFGSSSTLLSDTEFMARWLLLEQRNFNVEVPFYLVRQAAPELDMFTTRNVAIINRKHRRPQAESA
jgi:hypothetical protein